MRKSSSILFLFFVFSSLLSVDRTDGTGTILFTTLGRSLYGFDIFATFISSSFSPQVELQLTDGISVNYNGFFASSPFSLLSLFPHSASISRHRYPFDALVYVTERSGYSTIYLDLFPSSSNNSSHRREALELPTRLQYPLLPPPSPDSHGRPTISMKDRPTLSGDRLIYVSTHEPSLCPRQSWAAVYSTHLPTGATTRLTPTGVADFSPVVSPSGRWIAVASSGQRGWSGEVQDLNTSIYLFKSSDGSLRTSIVEHGGWPSWADESNIFFHRQSSEGWWSVYKASISTEGDAPYLISIDRITPPGFHAFTPAASSTARDLLLWRRGDPPPNSATSKS
ncbi:hypothetical protein HPP92_002718 [Vanilla planifolia]|uniref:Uncharacterized protein n=1 Tax=Vanilla planifolia TaxID=51239 RepID=A0A835VN06_VANPL|nr:hypothetical protein HPP92_002718 [Vanilla planifolia]